MGKAKLVDWRKAHPAALVLVSGGEDYLADRAIRLIRDSMRVKDSGLEIHNFSAGDYSSGQLAAMASPSLFQEPRLIVIEGVERCSDALIEDGIQYLSNPSDDTTIVLRHNSSSVRGKKLIEAIRVSDIAIEIACVELKRDADKAHFVQSEFAAAERKVTPGAVRALCEAFSDDLSELAAACSQLISDSAETIDEQIVDNYYGGRVETNAFKVADAALAGKSADALALLRHALATGADPVPVVAAIGMKVRLMAKVFGNRYASPSTIGAQPWQINRAREDLAGWSEEGLAEAVMAIATTDAAVKGMERDPIFALEKLVLLLANRGQKNTEAN
ncbi:MAG: DNA polymerase III subunit delta [Actinomycetota bacterium]